MDSNTTALELVKRHCQAIVRGEPGCCLDTVELAEHILEFIAGDIPAIPYDWARVECPTCGAKPDRRCRALTSGRTTDAHRRRYRLGNLWRDQTRLADKGFPVGDAP